MQEKLIFEEECMLDMRSLKMLTFKVRKFLGDKRERDEDRERETQRLIKSEDVKTQYCHDLIVDSSTSEGESVGACICPLRLVSSLSFRLLDKGTFYEKTGDCMCFS
ncbi:hypothetical protein HanOQP8_Chr13g0473911 [Helianthus annuus]|nr:hypothetical protein HanOQP8_Chr13g0473911 [Helianthus annuus]